MSFVYFGPTDYDKLRIKIERPTNLIEISLEATQPEFLNLGKIEFIQNNSSNTFLNIFDFEHQASAWLSSRAGNDDRKEATFEVSKGADIHSKKETNPKLTIKLKKPISNCTMVIENRSDYYGIRSSTIKIETFERTISAGRSHLSRVSTFSLQSAIPNIKEAIRKHFLPGGNKDASDEEVRATICESLDGGRMDIESQPWNMVINITSLPKSKADAESIKIWAAFLISQHLRANDTSILNLLNPEDDTRLSQIIAAIDKYAETYSPNINAEKILFSKAIKLVNESKWRLAHRIYSILFDLNSHNVDYLFGLAESLDSLKRHDEAKSFYELAVKSSPGLKPDHLKMLFTNHKRIRPRIEMYEFISSRIDEIRKRGIESLSKIDGSQSNKVFCYWAQGFDAAPPIVPACQRQLKKFTPNDSIVLLHEKNIKNYIAVPEFVKNKLSTRSAFFSDILRLLLLSRYGGTWIDSTCYLTHNLEVDHHPEHGAFTAFKVGPPSTLSVWYLKARNDSWIVHLWKEAMLMYWENYDDAINYFIFHHIFEALYRLDERFRSERDAVIQLPSSKPHEWYFKLSEDFNREDYHEICTHSNIHKLTYKTNPQMDRPDSFYSYAVRGF